MRSRNKLLWVLVIGLVTLGAGRADALEIRPEMLHFTYQTFNGGISLACKHVLVSAASQDWSVKCSDPALKLLKSYQVHLWVTRYDHAQGPRRVSFEVLYWVTDLSDPSAPKAGGDTIWFHLRNPADLDGIEVSQSLEGDTAGLYLELDPAP
jgi:hypothetical protein